MYYVTLTTDRRAGTLEAGRIAAVRDAVGGGTLETLSDGEAVQIALANEPDTAAIAASLAGAAVDAIVTGADHRRKRLLLADMDSTIVTSETLDEIAAHAGLKDRIAAITRRSMNGEIDFAEALRLRVRMLEGLPVAALQETWRRTEISPGARELVATMRANGAHAALVSGGFTFFTERVAALLGFDSHRANTLLVANDVLTGGVATPILDRDAKRTRLRELARELDLDPRETLAVGDGANDLAMLADAGLGVAYRAKPVVAAAARARIEHSTLRALLFAQGYRAAEIVTAE
jgi:phosphoserine phosphatase